MLADSTFRSLVRHEDYYIQGGDLHLQVEHVQFRVHRYFFDRESVYFRTKLATPASPGATRSGTTDSTAFVLEDVRSSDFARFLWVFYNPKYSLYKADVDAWTSILDLAHRWQFPEVKNLCVRELEKLEMSDVERIYAYHKYDVDRNLLIPRYAALCEREEPLSIAEGMRLGMETALTLARAREIARSKPADSGLRSPIRADVPLATMQDIIKGIFNITSPTTEETTSPTTAVNGNDHTLTNGTGSTNGTALPPLNGASTSVTSSNANGAAENTDVFGLLLVNTADATKSGSSTEADKTEQPNGTEGSGTGAGAVTAATESVSTAEPPTPSRIASPNPANESGVPAGRGRGNRNRRS